MDGFISILKNIEIVDLVEPQEIIIEEVGYQPSLEREVIVRRLTPAAVGNPWLRNRFIQEVRTLASLCHPHIVPVYDAGIDDNNLPYVVLAKPRGITLQKRLDQLIACGIRMDIEEITATVAGVTEAVEYSHQHSLLLHDLSPGNIVLTTTGRPVLMGLGRPLPEDVLTAPTTTLAYASPERLFGRRVDGRSDIYGLGVLTYHLIFGHLPFEGGASEIVAQKQDCQSLPPIDGPNAESFASDALVHALRRATARQLSHRFADVDAFRTAITNALSSQAASFQVGSIPRHPDQNKAAPRFEASQAGELVPTSGADITVLPVAPGSGRNGKGKVVARIEPHQEVADAGSEPAHAQESGDSIGSLRAGDLLMPGRENPSLLAAFDFTTLVPMPEAVPETEGGPEPSMATASRKAMPHYPWLAWIVALAVLALIAATRLG
jgi:serine/threonine protein kinase